MKQHLIQFLLIFFLIFFSSCAGQSTVNNSAEQNKSVLTKSQLEGHWKFVTAEEVGDIPFLGNYPNRQTPTRVQDPEAPVTEGLFKRPDLNLIFENDTMYEVQYPTNINKRDSYSVDSGYLHWHAEHYPIQLVHDTLFLYKSFGRGYLKEVYIKTSLNDSIVDILKRHNVNYPELAGTWFLIRVAGFDDGSQYTLDFPHKIPDSIEITREDFITALENDKVYMMPTDGKKRKYVLSYNWSYLSFTPGKWYKGEDPWIHYSRKQTDN